MDSRGHRLGRSHPARTTEAHALTDLERHLDALPAETGALHAAISHRSIATQLNIVGAGAGAGFVHSIALTPFARVAVILTLGIIGAQAAFPLMWLDDTLSLTAIVPGLIATAIPMVFLFVMPLLPIQRRISAAKAMEIERLDAAIAALTRSNSSGVDYIVPLAALLAYCREIEAVRELPFNTGVASRLAIHLVIPPFTWIVTALIQHFVEGAL